MELTAQEDAKAHLMATDEEFRRLALEHLAFDEKTQKLEAKHARTEADETELHRLKKLKLQLKDQMTEKLNRHRSQHVA